MAEVRRFRAMATRGDQKYAGTFPADSMEDARAKLESQGYEVLLLSEARSRWPMAIALFSAAIFLGSLIIWAIVHFRRDPEVVILTPPKAAEKQHRSPLTLLGKWTAVKSGYYLIAAEEDACTRAVQFRDAGYKKNLADLLTRQEAGWTKQYGGGQKVYVIIWRATTHVLQVKFDETDEIAWVEENALV